MARLFTTSLEIDDSAAARLWCGELGRTFDGSWLARYCVLEQMAWDGPPPGVTADSIRRYLRGAIEASPATHHAHPRIEMVGAVALSRLGSPDALAALRAVASSGGPDPQLLTLAAWGHLVLGDADAAVALLDRAADVNPRLVRSNLQSRRFESIRSDPRLRSVIADGG